MQSPLNVEPILDHQAATEFLSLENNSSGLFGRRQ
jgi:hypothetical protein